MSEYQRYEFMTIDRPLTREQLDAVNNLSSHIEASATHAVVEYNWGSFKHNPITVLHKFFDGFLYWANWGSPRLALRFPHGAFPEDLIESYDFYDYVEFTEHADYDILDIHFGELEGPDEWMNYELGSLIAIRDELMEGDVRALYITWLATGGEDEERDEDDIIIPPIPPGFAKLTAAQHALAELLQVPDELLVAAAQHSSAATPSTPDDFAAWIELLPANRRNDYLLRLAHNEPGLSRMFVKELRELGRGKPQATPPSGERVSYATLDAESVAIKARLERERHEQEMQARQRHLQDIHNRQGDYWRQVEQAASRGTSSGYDEATRLLTELREAADQFKESQQFQARFSTWVRSHLRRPALLKRLQERKFPLPT